MSELRSAVLDQHTRVQSAGENGYAVLGEAKGEILSVATPDATQDILDKTTRITDLAWDSVKSHMVGVREPNSLPRRLAKLGSSLYTLSSRSGLIVPDQGYIGLITLNAAEQADDIYGFSTAPGQKIQENDPIQEACGSDFFYPPMMWVKALYSEAYKNRRESQRELPIQTWLAELAGEGLFQGSKPVEGGLLGATGFMPSGGQSGMMAKLKKTPKRKEHLLAEKTKPFRASGLMDQAALSDITSSVGIDKTEVVVLAGHILVAGGSLN